jgi:predicted MFS family arabinose efflux permease
VSQTATLLGAVCGGAMATAWGTRWALASGALCCAAAAAWVATRLRNE